MTQNELNDFLAEHKEWLESRAEAIDEIWGKSSDEQRNSTNTIWISEGLRKYKLKGKQLCLKSVNLSGLNLANSKYFVDLVLENVDLRNSNCENSWFSGTIKNVNFRKANLQKADFSNSIMENVDFTNAILNSAKFNDSEMQKIDFTGANLEEAEMMFYVAAKYLKFDNAKINRAKFIKSPMDFVSFRNTSLVGASFRRAHIDDSSFENADLRDADFTFVSLYRCKVSGANIKGADFSDARHLPEEWKQEIGWYSEEQENIRRIKQHLREHPVR